MTSRSAQGELKAEIARATQLALTGEDGVLTRLVTNILERCLELEMTAHLGRQSRPVGRIHENSRNGRVTKQLLMDVGTVKVGMPRDRLVTFDPVIVPKHGRRLTTPTAELARLCATGMTDGDIHSRLLRITKSRLDPETAHMLADNLGRAVHVWQRRRLEGAYPMLVIDAIPLDRTHAQHLDFAVAVHPDGHGELLSVSHRPFQAQGSDRWSPMFGDLRYRGITEPGLIVADGDPDLADAAFDVWPHADVRPGIETHVTNALREPPPGGSGGLG